MAKIPVATTGHMIGATALVGGLVGALPGAIVGGVAGAIDKEDSVFEGMGKGMLIGSGIGIAGTGIMAHKGAKKLGYNSMKDLVNGAIDTAMQGLGHDGVGLV